MSEVLERVRMCVAEAGYDPAGIDPPSREADGTFTYNPVLIPRSVAWRAAELAECYSPMCLACCIEAIDDRGAYVDEDTADCLADRRLVLDCGRPR